MCKAGDHELYISSRYKPWIGEIKASMSVTSHLFSYEMVRCLPYVESKDTYGEMPSMGIEVGIELNWIMLSCLYILVESLFNLWLIQRKCLNRRQIMKNSLPCCSWFTVSLFMRKTSIWICRSKKSCPISYCSKLEKSQIRTINGETES